MKRQQPPPLLGSISLVDSRFASRLTSKYGWLVGRSAHRAGFVYLTPSGRRASAGSGRDLHIRVQRNYASYYLKLLQTFQLDAPATVPRAASSREQRRARQTKAGDAPVRQTLARHNAAELETQVRKRALLELESLKHTVRKLTAATARLEPLKRAGRRDESRIAPIAVSPAPRSAAAPGRDASLAGRAPGASVAGAAAVSPGTASASSMGTPEGKRQDRAERQPERLVHLVERTIRVQYEQIARMQAWKQRLADAGRATSPYSESSSAQGSAGHTDAVRKGQAVDRSASGRLSGGEEAMRRINLSPGRTASDRQTRRDDAAGGDGAPLPRSAQGVIDARRRGSQSTLDSGIAGRNGRGRSASESEGAEQRTLPTPKSGTAERSSGSDRSASESEGAERWTRPTPEPSTAERSSRSASLVSESESAEQPSRLVPATAGNGVEIIRRTGLQPYARMSALVHRDLRMTAWPGRKTGLARKKAFASNHPGRADDAAAHAMPHELQARRASLPVSAARQPQMNLQPPLAPSASTSSGLGTVRLRTGQVLMPSLTGLNGQRQTETPAVRPPGPGRGAAGSNAAQDGRLDEAQSATERRVGGIGGESGGVVSGQSAARAFAVANVRSAGRLPSSYARSVGLADRVRSRLQASPLAASIRITSLPLRTQLAADLDSTKASTSIAASERGASGGSRRQSAVLIYTSRGKQSASGRQSGERSGPVNNNLTSGQTSRRSEPNPQGTAGNNFTVSGRQSALGGIWLSSAVNSRNDAPSSESTSAGGRQQSDTAGPHSAASTFGVSNAGGDTRRTGTGVKHNSDSSPGGTGAGGDGAVLENSVTGNARGPAADRRRIAEASPITDNASRNVSSNEEDEQSARARSNAPQAQLSAELANPKGMLVSDSARIRDWLIRTTAGVVPGPRLSGGPVSQVHAKHAVGSNALLRRLQARGPQVNAATSPPAGPQTDRRLLSSISPSRRQPSSSDYIAARGTLRITHRRSASVPTGHARAMGEDTATHLGVRSGERMPTESAPRRASATASDTRPANIGPTGTAASVVASSIQRQARAPGRRAATVSRTAASPRSATPRSASAGARQGVRPLTAGLLPSRLSISGGKISWREMLHLPYAERYRLMTTVESIGRLPFDELSARGDSQRGAPLLLRASLAERLIHKLDRIAREGRASNAAPSASGGAGARTGGAGARPSSRVVARPGREAAWGEEDAPSNALKAGRSPDSGRTSGQPGAVQPNQATSAARLSMSAATLSTSATVLATSGSTLSTSAPALATTSATRTSAALVARNASVTGDRRASRLAASLALVASRLARWQAPRTIALSQSGPRSARADATSASATPGAAGPQGASTQARRSVLPVTVHISGRRSAASLAATSGITPAASRTPMSGASPAASRPTVDDASLLPSSPLVQPPTTAEVSRQPQTPSRPALQALRRSSMLSPSQTSAVLAAARRHHAQPPGRVAATLATARRGPAQPSGRVAATLATARRRPGQSPGLSVAAPSAAARLRNVSLALTPRLLSSARLMSLTASAMVQAAAAIELEPGSDTRLTPLQVGPPPPSSRAGGPPRLTAGQPMTRSAQQTLLQHKSAPPERPASAIDAGSIARQSRPAPRPVPMELAIRGRAGAGVQQAQERAIHKSLTRLESELKELRTQPSASALDVRAVTDQMYREITRRMRFEQQRRGL